MKRILLALLLALALSTTAFALEVPTDTTVQNLNGSQQLIKTYILPPDADPQELIEAPFKQEGYLYTFAEIVKSENMVQDQRYQIEQVTQNSETNSLAAVLELFSPTLDYDDGEYSGTLALDHSGLLIEPSGYTTKTKTISATQTIGPVDRNDMSYVPATTVQDGVTLSCPTWIGRLSGRT